eukprot:TRINITY_DN3014_c0_g1_i6.p1 TRINITY_DN3014_c0_g1~~TRINITY_DN3014_c0_g1_i6.p1  ORF type:complete len:309 (-),score=11.17 TRINITY_DN3014_c0_g1_i6:649-1575(-)
MFRVLSVILPNDIQDSSQYYVAHIDVEERRVTVYNAWHNTSAQVFQNEDFELPSLNKLAKAGNKANVYRNRKLNFFQPEQVIGFDERQLVTRQTSYPWNTIGLIRMYRGFSIASFCTGVLIEDRVVLTSAHCLYDQNRDEFYDAYTFSPGESEGYKPYGTYYSTNQMVTKAYSGGKDAFDFGLMLLTRSPPVGQMVVGYSCSVTSADLNIAGYPYDLRYSNSRLDMYAEFCADTPIDMCPSTDISQVFHFCDTSGGMSGAPMWQYNSYTGERKIRAIHSGSYILLNKAIAVTPYVLDFILDTFDYWGV